MKYTVSVTYEVTTPESAEAGDVEETGFERENEILDQEELKRLIGNYGFAGVSSSHLTGPLWLMTLDPVHDRDFFEKGLEKTYGLHLKAVNDQPPMLEDYADLLRLAGIRLPGMENVGSNL